MYIYNFFLAPAKISRLAARPCASVCACGRVCVCECDYSRTPRAPETPFSPLISLSINRWRGGGGRAGREARGRPGRPPLAAASARPGAPAPPERVQPARRSPFDRCSSPWSCRSSTFGGSGERPEPGSERAPGPAEPEPPGHGCRSDCF